MEKNPLTSLPTIYLDHATLAPPSDFLLSQMERFMKTHWHSLNAPYLRGKEPFASMEVSLEAIRALAGADVSHKFQFYPSGAHALSDVYHSVYMTGIAENGKNHGLVAQGDWGASRILEHRLGKLGVYQKTVPLDSRGTLTPDALKRALTAKTGFFSASWASPWTGVMQPIWELGEICSANGILFHVEASQVLGKVAFDLEDLPVDYLTFEGTILHGPKGSGGAFIKKGALFHGRLVEEVEQESLNLPAFIGLGIAAQELAEAFDHVCFETLRLRDRLESGILRAVPNAQVLFKEGSRLPNITCIAFPGVMGELLAFHLKERGLFASFGREDTLARFLKGVGLDPVQSQCALAFSLSHTTTEGEIDRAVALIVDGVETCQMLSKEAH